MNKIAFGLALLVILPSTARAEPALVGRESCKLTKLAQDNGDKFKPFFLLLTEETKDMSYPALPEEDCDNAPQVKQAVMVSWKPTGKKATAQVVYNLLRNAPQFRTLIAKIAPRSARAAKLEGISIHFDRTKRVEAVWIIKGSDTNTLMIDLPSGADWPTTQKAVIRAIKTIDTIPTLDGRLITEDVR